MKSVLPTLLRRTVLAGVAAFAVFYGATAVQGQAVITGGSQKSEAKGAYSTLFGAAKGSYSQSKSGTDPDNAAPWSAPAPSASRSSPAHPALARPAPRSRSPRSPRW